jgi:hypothetical protein
VSGKDLWSRAHRWPRRYRWPVKVGFVGVVVLVVLFPKLWLLPSYFERLDHMTEVLDANCPALAPLEAEVAATVGPAAGLKDVLMPVERAVYRRIPYAYDWETWGVMDYLPTVAEVFALGQEDCDGRAVVAASLLQRLGYDAWLATDLKHMWVVTQDRRAAQPVKYELMSPGEGEKTLRGEGAGTRMTLTLATVRNSLRALTFGIAVFPMGRELIILVAVFAASLQPYSSWRRRAWGAGLLIAGLVLLRACGAHQRAEVTTWVCGVAGTLAVLGAWALLVFRAATSRLPAALPR